MRPARRNRILTRVNLFLTAAIERLAAGRHGDPGRVLGCRRHRTRSIVVACLPGAARTHLHPRRDCMRFLDTLLSVWPGRVESLPECYRVS